MNTGLPHTSVLDLLRLDLSWTHPLDGFPSARREGWFRVLRQAVRSRGFRAVLLHRFAHRAFEGGHRLLAQMFASILFHHCGATICPRARIGGGLLLPHPIGVVIGTGAELGQMVVIQQNVTIGGNFGKKDPDGRSFPRIGAMSHIYTGAVIAGPVDIGEYCCVGANAVVVKSFDPGQVIGGVPARVVRPQSSDAWRTAMAGAIAAWRAQCGENTPECTGDQP